MDFNNNTFNEELHKSVHNVADKLMSNGFVGEINPESEEAHKRLIEQVKIESKLTLSDLKNDAIRIYLYT